ncbi:MAG: hypothetical protein RLZZ227_486 [Pseudomonadota bacterium]|jgi:hypothetical protein
MNQTVVPKSSKEGFCSPDFLLLAGVNAVILQAVIYFEYELLHAENGPLEAVQAGLLAVGIVLFLLRARLHEMPAVFNLAASLFCFTSLLREVDVETFDIPVFMQMLGSGTGKRVLLGGLWLVLGYWLWREWNVRGLSRLLLNGRQLRLICAILLMFMISLVIDQQLVAHRHATLFEEMAETNAYLLIVCGALAGFFQRQFRERLATTD